MIRVLLALSTLLAVACVSDPAPPPPAVPAVAPVQVDVWHDTVCPWCRIGLHNLEVALAGLGDVPVELVHHPYLLEPDMPAEGRDLQAHYAAKFGADRMAGMFDRVTRAGAAAGVRFDFQSMKVSPATSASHALIEWAPSAKRAAVIAAVHKAHFEEGRNIGDAEVLSSIAASVGLDASEARTAVTDRTRLADLRRRAGEATAHVRGVPHFVIGGRTLNGAQPPETLRAAILEAR